VWKEENPEKHIVIAVNSSYGIAPWADYLFAMDNCFWSVKIADIKSVFKGRLVTSSTTYKGDRVEFAPCQNPGNSGAGAIGFAHYLGIKKIILLGYDCKYGEKGKRHFFGDHPPKMNGNAGSIGAWPGQFAQLARKLMRECVILNASRVTALKCFTTIDLETALNVA
jgi:hypothetical protein